MGVNSRKSFPFLIFLLSGENCIIVLFKNCISWQFFALGGDYSSVFSKIDGSQSLLWITQQGWIHLCSTDCQLIVITSSMAGEGGNKQEKLVKNVSGLMFPEGIKLRKA